MDLTAQLRESAARLPGRIALRDHRRAWTYRDFVDEVEALARGMVLELGVGHGHRVAWCALNRGEALIALFACARVGAVYVPLNNRLTPSELEGQVRDSGCVALFAEADFAAPLLQRGREMPALEAIVELGDSAVGYDTLLRDTAGDLPSGTPDDDLLLVYTSGTTGRPKGAVLTQAALAANAVNAQGLLDPEPDDEHLEVLPLFHVGGLNIAVTPALLRGAAVRLHRRFDPGAWLDAVVEHRPTSSILVPTMMHAVLEDPRCGQSALQSLRLLITGSAPVPHHLIEAFHDLGVPVCQVYGSTETAPIALHQRVADARTHVGSVGLPASLCELRIVDHEGSDVADGATGELMVRGPNLFRCYWGRPDETAEALRDGWYRTGDGGYRRSDGHVVVTERVRDVIITGGENVYPAEVEQALLTHRAVTEVAVVAGSDPEWGEVPVAFVVPGASRDVDLASLTAWLEGSLAHFKHPRAVVVVDELPRNAMGKVLKHELRERLRQETTVATTTSE